MNWPYNKFTFTFTVDIRFKDPCAVQWRLHKKHVKKIIMCCSGINITCLEYKIHTEFATSLFQNGIISSSAPPSEIYFCWLQQARCVQLMFHCRNTFSTCFMHFCFKAPFTSRLNLHFVILSLMLFVCLCFIMPPRRMMGILFLFLPTFSEMQLWCKMRAESHLH
jgi:hypothetical protein